MQQVLHNVLSLKGLIMLIALIALGLSIAAVVKGCPDKFGDTCYGYGACTDETRNIPCTSNSVCETDPDFAGTGRQCICGGGSVPGKSSCTNEMGKGNICTTPSCSNDCQIPPCEINVKKNYNPDKGQYGVCIDPNEKPKSICKAYDQCDDPDDCIGCPSGFECKQTGLNKSCQPKSGNTSGGHSRGGGNGIIGGNTRSRGPQNQPDNPPHKPEPKKHNPPHSGGLPEWAIITLSSVGGVLLLALIIYLLMRMKNGNKLI